MFRYFFISTKSDTVCIAVICPDTVMQSRPVVIKRVSFRMLGVKIDAKDMKYDSKSMTYHAYLPVTDFHGLRLKFNYRGDSVTFGDSTFLRTDCYSLDLSEPVRVTLWQDDLYKDRTLMRNDAAFWLSKQTDLPYTIRGQFVELVFNGKHVGNYYLCEQAKIDGNRIDIDDPNLETPELGDAQI